MHSDWLEYGKMVHQGKVKQNGDFYRQTDLKAGEDGIMYSAVNCHQDSLYTGKVLIYRSTNNGMNWNFFSGFAYPTAYVGNISMIVESKNNSVLDSTRVIVFYSKSTNEDLSGSAVFFYSVRVNGTSTVSGGVGYSHGQKLTYLSAVTDGAFYTSATYFGVVCAETSDNLSTVSDLRIYRTTDWGLTWVSSEIETGFNDHYPSAMYKPGGTDSVYIAVERKFSPTNSALRVIATKWNPSSNFYTYYVSTSSPALYEKPCLTIKQNFPADSIMITTTKNNLPVYHYTPNAGASWYTDHELDFYHGTNKIFTYCSSTPNGPRPFSAIFVSADGDSIQAKRSTLGFFNSNGKLQTNIMQPASATVAPVCITMPSPYTVNTAVQYAGIQNDNTFINQEGHWQVRIKTAIEGLYDPVTDKLSRNDTLRAYLVTVNHPYTVVDSAKSILDSSSLEVTFSFSVASVGGYYLKIQHRNSIATFPWDITSLLNFPMVEYNFYNYSGLVWMGNVKEVESSPYRYAIYSGDVNQDGIIDSQDLILISNDMTNFNTGYIPTDLTGDDYADVADLIIAYNNSIDFVTAKDPF